MEIGSRDRFEDFSNLVGAALKSLHKIKNHGMEPYGLGSTHTLCLKRLNAVPEGLTRTELASECEIDKAQISRLVGELTEKGYVCETSKGRGYRKKLVLTDNGRYVAEEIDAKVGRILSYVSGDIPKDELEIFYNTFETICENLRRAEEIPINDSNIFNSTK